MRPAARVIVLARREFQDGRDVFGFEVRIIGQDLFPSRASGQEIEHILHTNAKAANARATAANVWTDRDSVNRAHVIPLGPLASDRAIVALLVRYPPSA